MREAQSANRNMVAKTAKTATNVESNVRHSHEGSHTKGWWNLFLIDDRNEWAVTTLAMTFPFLGGIEHDISEIAVSAIT
jgi:hypothetical protein